MVENSERMIESIRQKLHPRRYPNMSPKMAAVVGYIVGEHWTDPALDDMLIQHGGGVLAQRVGDVGLNVFFADESDLRRNWENLLAVAGLTEDERAFVENLFDEKVTTA